MRVRRADVIVEDTSNGALVCDPRLGVVHRLDEQHAHYLRTATATGQLPDDDITRHLIDRAIVEQLPRPAEHLSRRTLLATAAATGITTLTLPTAAAAASTPTTPAPTGDLFLSADVTARELIVLWEPTPGPFTYTWTAFDITVSKTQLATGTQSASFFDIVVYTVPSGVNNVRLEVASQTSPVVSDFFETVL